nr:hypothetical protein [uncultured Duganella sp.]
MENILFSGLWQADSNDRYVWYDAAWDDFAARAAQLQASGYSLNALDVASLPSGARWAGVWQRQADPFQRLLGGLQLDELRHWDQAYAAQGLQAHCLRSCLDGGAQRWAACWQPGESASVLLGPMSWTAFWQAWLAQHAAGLRLVELDVSADGAQWSGIWHPGSGEQYLWSGADWNALAAQHATLRAQHYQLRAMTSYASNGKRRWAAVWHSGDQASSMVADLNEAQFWDEWQRQARRGMRLARLHLWPGSGYAPEQTLTKRLRLHLKILAPPSIPVERMLERMREVYEPAGMLVEVRSTELLNQPDLADVDVGDCSLSITGQQARLFSHRNQVAKDELVVYFVRSTLPPYNGCAAHPPDCPGAVVASYASEWTLGHEIGHVLGLSHVKDNLRLMTGLGTANITDPPPDLVATEIATMAASGLLRP